MAGWEPIEGETPIDDRSGLLLKHVRSRRQLNAAEAMNIQKAVVKYLAARPSARSAPFHLDWCLKLHREMFGDVWNWAGTVRRTDLNLGVPPFRIEIDLQQLTDDLRYWRTKSTMHHNEVAARLHHRAVLIHPFLNGNGRWSRMLANIFLRQAAKPLTRWPEETLGESSIIRSEYLRAIRLADAGDYEPLIDLHRRHEDV